MTEQKGVVYGPKADTKIQKTVREVARRMMNERPQRGRWQQRPSGGLSPIRFQIHEPDCDARMAVCRVLSRNGSVPGEYEIYGETEENEAGETVPSKFVDVYDKVNAFFNESNRNLAGRMGYASYLYGRPVSEYDPWWAFEVTTLGEQQTECEAF